MKHCDDVLELYVEQYTLLCCIVLLMNNMSPRTDQFIYSEMVDIPKKKPQVNISPTNNIDALC